MIEMKIISRDISLAKMAEGWNEKDFLGSFVQKQTKYGTTTVRSQKSSLCIKHKITDKDTLMGIALKYGITVRNLQPDVEKSISTVQYLSVD